MSQEVTSPAEQGELEALLVTLRRVAASVFAGWPVLLAYAYGSRIWGHPQRSSDLDVGYYLAPDAGQPCLSLRHELELADRLSAGVGVEIDLRCLWGAPLGLRGRVLTEGRRIYCSDEVARVDLERDLLGRYLDYKPELEALRELRFASLAERAKR